MKQNNNIKKEERFGLQALRGIGIIGIVLYHLFPSEFCGGFLGVPLFFVLSGYLMYTTSHAAGKKETFTSSATTKNAWPNYIRRYSP